MVATFNKLVRRHIFLHPADSRRKFAALKSALLKDKRKYCHKLEGALLDVTKLKVIGSRYLVVEGYSSMEVEADCCVFAPRPGHILEGVVNKQSFSHLGCLVMNIFNASLNIPSCKDMVPQIGDVVSFVVNEVVVDGDILFLRGSLEDIISRAPVVEPKQEEPDDPVTESVEATAAHEVAGEIKAEPSCSDLDSLTPSKKKKKSKHKIHDATSIKEEPLSSENDSSPQSSKHKKRKKEKIT